MVAGRQKTRLGVRVLIAAVIVAAAALVPAKVVHRAPRTDAERASGVLAQTNSKAGSAILNIGKLAPGGSESGTVTITNSGDLAGMFELGKSNLADAKGPGGGALSEALELEVRDETAEKTVYQGTLGEMGNQELGSFDPGEAHTYRFTVALPARGDSVDNLYAGASTTVQYDWVARAEPRPDPPATEREPEPEPAPKKAAPEKRRPAAPKVSVQVPRRQRLLRQRGVYLRVRCERPCVVDLKVRLKAGARSSTRPWRLRRSLPGGRRVKVLVRTPRRDLRRLRALLRRGRTVRVLVSARAKDRRGNVLKASAKKPIYSVSPTDGAARFP